MRPVLRFVVWLLRVVCYGALLAAIFALLTAWLVWGGIVCERSDATGLVCPSPAWLKAAELTALYLAWTVLTGIPVILALGGLAFMVVDAGRRNARNGRDRRGR